MSVTKDLSILADDDINVRNMESDVDQRNRPV